MNPNKLKQGRLEQSSQIIVFDESGTIMDSCHSLTNLMSWLGRPIHDLSPFFIGLLDDLANLKPDGLPIVYQAVENNLQSLNGVYDFEFFVFRKNGQRQYALLILDHTEHYESLRVIQQQRNLLLIKMEYLQIGRNTDI